MDSVNSPPSFNFDLSRSVKKRYDPIFDYFDLREMKRDVNNLLSPYSSTINIIDSLFGGIIKSKAMYVRELEYIANKLDVSFTGILLLQLIYEASSSCTCAVIGNENNDKFYLRTMDWELSILKKYTIQLNLNNDTRVITWLGYIGFLTAIKDDKMIVINYRRTESGNLMNNIKRLINMCWPIGYLIREYVTKDWDISVLENSQLISPCYISIFDLSNHKNSIILTRDCDKLVDKRSHTLVQTNCDWDKNIPNILYSIERRKYINKVRIDNEDTLEDILDKVLVFPVKNNATIYYWYYYEGESRCVICD